MSNTRCPAAGVETAAIVLHEERGCRFFLAGETLVIRRNAEEQARFNLAPASNRRWKLGPWRGEGNRRVAAGPGLAAEVVVGVDHGHLFYEVRARENFFPRFTYLPDSRIHASRWQTFVYNSDDRQWVADQDKVVGVTAASVVLGEVQATWYPNVAPHVAAYKLSDGTWLGMCVPGPLPVAELQFRWINRRFSLRFDYLRPSGAEGQMPRVYLAPGLSEPESALEIQAALTQALGFWRDRRGHPGWWNLPVWGLYDENCWVGGSGVNPPPPASRALTPARVKNWVKRVEAITGLREFFIMAEQGYFSRYGEFEPVASLGKTKGMRRLIDDLRRQGKRVGLYFHPFFVDRRIPEIARHPEWLAQGDAAPSAVPISANMQVAFVDWTHPDAREYLRRRIRYLLSAEEGCLNCDWLCVHNNHIPDPRQWKFHDPRWGVGDLLKFKVMREVYQAAKSAKPEALVRWIIAESWAQPFVDRVYLNEDWSDTCDNWFRMARIVTRTLPGTLVDATPWFLSRAKAREFWMVLPAFGIACNHPLSQFRIGRHGHWEQAQPEDHRRWAASWRVYQNAPMTADQERRLDYRDGELVAYRKYTRGLLAGFYAARTLGRRCFATYNEYQALVTSTLAQVVDVPLPPGMDIAGVETVRHEGRASACSFQLVKQDCGMTARLEAQDSGAEVLCYRIRYQPKRNRGN